VAAYAGESVSAAPEVLPPLRSVGEIADGAGVFLKHRCQTSASPAERPRPHIEWDGDVRGGVSRSGWIRLRTGRAVAREPTCVGVDAARRPVHAGGDNVVGLAHRAGLVSGAVGW
jgi:hypothetical protein